MPDIDKGIPLMKPTFFDDNDPNNPKKKTYIEREALMCVIEKSRRDNPHRDPNVKRIHDHEHRHFLGLVENQPTVGVVEVVRCCDCKHSRQNPDINNTCYLTCNLKYGIRGTLDPTDFCSYGKRKGD